jgi:hypothetical protein
MSAVILPCTYLLQTHTNSYFTIIFNVIIFLVALLFIINMKIFKFGLRGCIILLLLSIAVATGVIIL